MGIEPECHRPEIPHHATRFFGTAKSYGDIGFATAERNALPLRGERKTDIRVLRAEVGHPFSQEMRDQNRWCTEHDPADKRSVGGSGHPRYTLSSSVHLDGALEHLLADAGQPAGSWQAINEADVQVGLEPGKPATDRGVIYLQVAGGT
jgi:hypothetical protein